MIDLSRKKDVLDTANSLSWFLMDGIWMLGQHHFALAISPIVLLSGLLLCFVDRRPAFMAINAAIMCWIIQNTAWIMSEIHDKDFYLNISRTFFALGLISIMTATLLSKNLRDTFSHFRRFRLKDWA